MALRSLNSLGSCNPLEALAGLEPFMDTGATSVLVTGQNKVRKASNFVETRTPLDNK